MWCFTFCFSIKTISVEEFIHIFCIFAAAIFNHLKRGFATTYPPGSDLTLDDVIDQVLSEVTESLGVASEYGIEIYYPSVSSQGFVSNYAVSGPGHEDDDESDDFAATEGEEFEEEEGRNLKSATIMVPRPKKADRQPAVPTVFVSYRSKFGRIVKSQASWNGEALAHSVSRPYPRYDRAETQRKFERARAEAA